MLFGCLSIILLSVCMCLESFFNIIFIEDECGDCLCMTMTYIICLLQKVAHFKALLAKKKVSLPNVKLVSISFRACKYFMYAIF